MILVLILIIMIMMSMIMMMIIKIQRVAMMTEAIGARRSHRGSRCIHSAVPRVCLKDSLAARRFRRAAPPQKGTDGRGSDGGGWQRGSVEGSDYDFTNCNFKTDLEGNRRLFQHSSFGLKLQLVEL